MTKPNRKNSDSQSADIVLSWSVHLARTNPVKFVFVLAVILISSTISRIVIGGIAPLAVAITLIASLADFLFPVQYEITLDGAQCRMIHKRSEIRWEKVNNCYIDDVGIKLSPLPENSRLEGFRGVYLRFAGNKDTVIEAVKTLWKPK